MARGRKAVPDEIKALRGNPGKRALHLDGAQKKTAVEQRDLQKPTFLKTTTESEIFKRVSTGLNRINFIKPTDVDVLGRWCFYMAKWINLNNRINQKDADVYYDTDSKHVKMLRTHPIFASLLQIERILMALEDRLGLNPSARQTMIRGLINAPNLPSGDLFGAIEKPTGKKKDVPTETQAPVSAIGFLNTTH